MVGKLMRAFSPASLNWLPRTLSKAIRVTTATVSCIPGLDKATELVGNYNHDNRDRDWVENQKAPGTEKAMILLSPKLAIANPIKVKRISVSLV